MAFNSSYFLVFLLLSVSIVMASSQQPLQDFCVAEPSSQVLLNGRTCKNPQAVVADDFFFSGLHISGNSAASPIGSIVTPVFAAQLPGLNTLGVSLARIDYAPGGLVSPHVHPRASEILTVLQGKIEVGFVTSNPENRHFRKVLEEGDVYVFPQGLVHYQRNVGYENAFSISALSSENPGVTLIPNTVFGANPNIDSDVLVKAFQLDKNVVTELQFKF